ncbi:hypothetical protein RHGRI_035620 [Rhododendron griersonianum]|uniref:Reticulon-like protein n=1 Tax=Rhododendron griersonianum TaxID=479676 RepID=A0AAV6HJW6_9ERIC|nr:hypothetical protein RHGRI_035620 [Rhododendron griersonianum]
MQRAIQKQPTDDDIITIVNLPTSVTETLFPDYWQDHLRAVKTWIESLASLWFFLCLYLWSIVRASRKYKNVYFVFNLFCACDRNEYGVADVLLWRRWCGAVILLGSSTALWFLFEWAGYNLLSFTANVLLLLVAILFFWAKSAPLLNSWSKCETFLQAASGLWVISYIGSFFNFLTLVYIVFNQKTLYNAYKKWTKNVEIDIEEYNRMKEVDLEFYKEASTLQYGKDKTIMDLVLENKNVRGRTQVVDDEVTDDDGPMH